MVELGLTQAQLANAVGMTQPAIGKCLKGNIPSADNLYYLSKALGLTMEDLLTGQEKRVAAMAEEGAEYLASVKGERKTETLKKEVAKLRSDVERLESLLEGD